AGTTSVRTAQDKAGHRTGGSVRGDRSYRSLRPMINGKDALVEEFVLHRLGAGDVPSVFNDFSAVLQGPEEQTFLRRLFLKPFSQAAETFTFAEGEDGDVFHGL